MYECERLSRCVSNKASQFIQPLISWVCFHSVCVYVFLIVAVKCLKFGPCKRFSWMHM